MSKAKKHPLHTNKAREWVRDLLKNEMVTIEFEKKDGTIRSMLCTLKEDVLQEEDATPTAGKTHSSDVCPVYDLEDHSWKSFRWESVRSIHFTLV
jgi:WYL_2, Sm-like SH3 beta-barrel fold